MTSCASQPRQATRNGARVLIVDDDVDLADVLQELLTFEGHDVAVAHDGRGALQQASSFEPEFVFLDGKAVCRALAASRERRPCIIAMTGAVEIDTAGLREVGFDGHVTKPVDLRHVLGLLAC